MNVLFVCYGGGHVEMCLPVLRALRTRVFFDCPPFYLAMAGKAFDVQGQLTDSIQRDRLADFLREFVVFAARK